MQWSQPQRRSGRRNEADRQQCAPEQTHRICEVPVNGSNSDTSCCGATGATCGAPDPENGDATAPYCRVGYSCNYNTGNSTGVCQQAPEDL